MLRIALPAADGRETWLASLKEGDAVFIFGWGGVSLGIGAVVNRRRDALAIKYPNGHTERFCPRTGVAMHRDNFDLIYDPAIEVHCNKSNDGEAIQ